MNKRCPECGKSLIDAGLENIVASNPSARIGTFQKYFCSESCREKYYEGSILL